MTSRITRRALVGASAVSVALPLASCSVGSTSKTPIKIVAGSENKLLEELIQKKADDIGAQFDFTYLGSVDMARLLETQGSSMEYDFLWPAHSMWLTLGDTHSVVRDAKSVIRTPVVFALKREIAKSLGWATDDGGSWKSARDVSMDDILKAAVDKKYRFAMTNATQSNSGASAYLAMCYAFSGHPQVLTAENLNDPNMAGQVQKFLSSVNRSSGSSGFLVDLMKQDYDANDAMFNYEALVIELNQALVKDGKDPLWVVYPSDGMVIADSPFAMVDKGDQKKADIFKKTQEHLLSDDVQKELLKRGRRNGELGVNLSWNDVDKAVFNPDWGIDVERVITTFQMPKPDVIWQAFDLYQTSLRKPSAVVFCLDFSGSMGDNNGEGEKGVKNAIHLLLDPESAKQYLLQAGQHDFTAIIPFDNASRVREGDPAWMVQGNDPARLAALDAKVGNEDPGGGTNIYQPIADGYAWLDSIDVENYSAAIVLLTDGRANDGSMDDVMSARDRYSDVQVPIYSIMMGDAKEEQLQPLADLSPKGKIFDGRNTDISKILREVRGYV